MISLELLWAVWGPVQCQIFACPDLYFFSKSTMAPQMHSLSLTAGLYSVALPLLGQSPLLFFPQVPLFCLQVFSVSDLCPDMRVQNQPLIWTHLTHCVVESKGHCKRCWHMWGDLAVVGAHISCHSPRHCPSQAPRWASRTQSHRGRASPQGADLGL